MGRRFLQFTWCEAYDAPMVRQKDNVPRLVGSESRRLADWGTALFLVCAPLWVFPLSISPYMAKIALVSTGIVISLVVSAVVWWRRRAVTVRIPWVFLGGALLVVASLVSLVQANNWAYALASLVLLVLYAGFGLLVANLGDGESTVRRILSALLIAGAASLVLGILQYIGVFGDPLLLPIDRITGTFGNRNYLGSFLGVIAFPAASLVLTRQRWHTGAIVWIGVALCFLGPVLIQQLGVLVALAAGAMFLVAATLIFRLGRVVRSHWRPVLAIALAALIGVGVGLGLWFRRPLLPTQQTSGSFIADVWATNSGWAREVYWGTAWELFETHPVTGVGLGNYKVDFIDGKTLYVSSQSQNIGKFAVVRAAQSHNDYLQALAELGGLGGVAILVIVALLVWSSWTRCARMEPGPRQLEFLLLLAGVVVAGVHATVSFPFHLPVTGLAVVTLLGLASSKRYGDRGVWQHRVSSRVGRGVAVVIVLFACLVGVVGERQFAAHLTYVKGISEMDAGDLEQAQASFTRSAATSLFVTAADFRLASVALLRSDTARQQGDTAGAEALVKLASEHAQRWCDTYPTDQGLLMLAGIEVMQQKYDAAEQVLARLLDSGPRSVYGNDARYLRAVIAVQSGRVQDAQEQLRTLIEAQPTYVQSYILLGRLLAQAGDAGEASQVLNQGLEMAKSELSRIDTELTTADLNTRTTLESDRQRLELERQTILSLLDGL